LYGLNHLASSDYVYEEIFAFQETFDLTHRELEKKYWVPLFNLKWEIAPFGCFLLDLFDILSMNLFGCYAWDGSTSRTKGRYTTRVLDIQPLGTFNYSTES
jgi:hypothetical protein